MSDRERAKKSFARMAAIQGTGKDYERLEYYARDVWDAKDLEQKKQQMHRLLNALSFKSKVENYRKAVDSAKTSLVIDNLAASLTLIASGDKVIGSGRYGRSTKW